MPWWGHFRGPTVSVTSFFRAFGPLLLNTWLWKLCSLSKMAVSVIMEMWKFSNISLAVLELNNAEKHTARHPNKQPDMLIANSKNTYVSRGVMCSFQNFARLPIQYYDGIWSDIVGCRIITVTFIEMFGSDPLKWGERSDIECISQYGNCDVRCWSPGYWGLSLGNDYVAQPNFYDMLLEQSEVTCDA
jgi:hypothetical protein